MDNAELRSMMRDRVGLRVGADMGKYFLRKIGESNQLVAVIGRDARTGLPRREVVDPKMLGIHSQ
ncbi:MAG TPA: hypothetical protein VGG44_08190 [Tepidisphaeraceae bacterium]